MAIALQQGWIDTMARHMTSLPHGITCKNTGTEAAGVESAGSAVACKHEGKGAAQP